MLDWKGRDHSNGVAMVDNRFINFIKKHHVLTIASTVGDEPWCANCFYAYLEEENAFVFTSDGKTRHGSDFLKNNRVAGTIVLETSIVGKIQGIQFQGKVEEPSGEIAKKAKTSYLKRFPFAVFMDTHLWVVRLDSMKLTDNRLGFGKKLLWP